MSNKPARTIPEQIQLLKDRGMTFRDESNAAKTLINISYYRLKGYWWDMQSDFTNHVFKPDSVFEDVVNRYNFDRNLRLILFDAIERIEISFRTKIIHILSMKYGGAWYLKKDLFSSKELHSKQKAKLKEEFSRSQEVFIKDHKRRYPSSEPDSWKILEVASLGTLSKLYKNLIHNLPEKSLVANEMGLNLHSELSSWLESITIVRNIIAHHSRLWSRNMVKWPTPNINNPKGAWLTGELKSVQMKKPFLVISAMVYLCNGINLNHGIKDKILKLFSQYPDIPIYKLGFLDNWERHPIWK